MVKRIVSEFLPSYYRKCSGMETVKQLLHSIFTEDTIKFLALDYIAVDPACIKQSKIMPDDMSLREFNRLASDDKAFKNTNDTAENKERFKNAVKKYNLSDEISSGRGLTDTEKYAAMELYYLQRWM